MCFAKKKTKKNPKKPKHNKRRKTLIYTKMYIRLSAADP